jgi:tetratricopeptide (TPR) repeat protein
MTAGIGMRAWGGVLSALIGGSVCATAASAEDAAPRLDAWSAASSLLTEPGIDWRHDKRIAKLARELERQPDSASEHLALSRLLYASARYGGSRDQLEWSLREAGECLRLEPRSAECALVRGRIQLTASRLDAARGEANLARELGADALEVALLCAEIDWAEGKYAEATQVIRRVAERLPTADHLVIRARLEHELGHYPFAEHLLVRAVEELDGSEPVQAAWIDALRGAYCRQLGRLETAERLLRRALRVAPGLPSAAVELARVLVARGDARGAAKVYRSLIGTTSEPEYIGELASLQRSRGYSAGAAALDQEAHWLFEEGLARYPEALRLSAARFYLADGRDVVRALQLLSGTRGFRSSAELELTARAHLAAGRLADAEEAVHAALSLAPVSLQLLQTAQLTYRSIADLSP